MIKSLGTVFSVLSALSALSALLVCTSAAYATIAADSSPQAAQSSQPLQLSCVAEPRNTSVFVYPKMGQSVLRVLHHNGTGLLPLTTLMPVTPDDLPKLAERAKLLQALGSEYDILLPEKSCHANGDLLSCYGKIDQVLNGHKLSWFSLDLAKSSLKMAEIPEPLERANVTISLTVDDQELTFSMLYKPNQCTLSVPGGIK